jgi:hypothetical protein
MLDSIFLVFERLRSPNFVGPPRTARNSHDLRNHLGPGALMSSGVGGGSSAFDS